MLFETILSCVPLSCALAGPLGLWAQMSTLGLREVEYLNLLTQLSVMRREESPHHTVYKGAGNLAGQGSLTAP